MTDVRFVVLHHRGPAWIPWKTMVEQPGTTEHVAHWAAWFEAGKLAWADPTPMRPAAGSWSRSPDQRGRGTGLRVRRPGCTRGHPVAEIRPWLVAMKADG